MVPISKKEHLMARIIFINYANRNANVKVKGKSTNIVSMKVPKDTCISKISRVFRCIPFVLHLIQFLIGGCQSMSRILRALRRRVLPLKDSSMIKLVIDGLITRICCLSLKPKR